MLDTTPLYQNCHEQFTKTKKKSQVRKYRVIKLKSWKKIKESAEMHTDYCVPFSGQYQSSR